MFSNHSRHRRFYQLVSESFSQYNKEFYALEHTHCALSPEDYPTLDYRTGCHHRNLGIMSDTLQKWANDFAVSDGLSVCYSLGDFPCAEDLRTDMDSLGGSERRSEVLTSLERCLPRARMTAIGIHTFKCPMSTLSTIVTSRHSRTSCHP